ncbi:MAG: hypothetical protein ACK4NS_08305 [Saprospiraceae bacterium]
MQKLWLKDFDLFISASLEESGAALAQQGAVRRLNEVERNFWVAVVSDQGQDFETEIILSPNKIKSYTCECWTDKRRRMMCPHIVASLLTIRRYLDQQRQADPEPAPDVEPGRRRISLQDAVSSAPESALRAFLLAYAKTDRRLAYQLRIEFAEYIAGLESPLEAVVDQAFPAQVDRPNNRSHLESLRQSLGWLRKKMRAAIDEQHCAEAWRILSASAYALQKANAAGPEFRDLALTCHEEILSLWLSLSPGQLSPELLDEVEQALTNMGLEGQIPPALEIAALRWLLGLPARPYQRYAEWFSEGAHPSPFFLTGLLAGDLALRGRDESALKVLRANDPSAAEAMRCIALFIALQTPNAALRTAIAHADDLLCADHEALRADLLRVVEAYAAHIDGDLLREWLMRSGDAAYLSALRRAYGPGVWAARVDDLIETLRGAGHEEALAMALIAENRLEEVIDIMASRPHVASLLGLLSSARPDYETVLADAAIRRLGAYLETHFGDPASMYVVQLVQKLHAAGLRDGAARIAGAILQQFPDRVMIASELRERKIPVGHVFE